MSEVKWIKITTDIFDDEKMVLIEQLPEADSIIVIWFKLLCLAGKMNNSGVFILNDKIPYTEKMLAQIFRRKESTVSLALKTFEEFGMIEIVNGAITIPNWGKHQNLDQLENKREYMRNYMQGYREKQKQIACKTNSKTNSKTNVRQADKDIDKEKDIDNNTPLYPPTGEKPSKGKTMLTMLQERNFSKPIEDIMTQWLKYKSEKKSSYKETGLKVLLDKVERLTAEYGEDAVVDVVIRSMEKNYQGVVWEWLEETKPKEDKQGFERFAK